MISGELSIAVVFSFLSHGYHTDGRGFQLARLRFDDVADMGKPSIMVFSFFSHWQHAGWAWLGDSYRPWTDGWEEVIIIL